jgi:hypothetical protein
MSNVQKLDAVLTEVFAMVERVDERITKDQQETARLRAETRGLLAKLKAH